MKSLAAPALAERLAARAPPLLLDVREIWEFQYAHIPGSVHIPMGQIPARHGELDPAAETVVICHHGVRSAQVVEFLDRLGFAAVYNLDGGVDAWSRQVDPALPVY